MSSLCGYTALKHSLITLDTCTRDIRLPDGAPGSLYHLRTCCHTLRCKQTGYRRACGALLRLWRRAAQICPDIYLCSFPNSNMLVLKVHFITVQSGGLVSETNQLWLSSSLRFLILTPVIKPLFLRTPSSIFKFRLLPSEFTFLTTNFILNDFLWSLFLRIIIIIIIISGFGLCS